MSIFQTASTIHKIETMVDGGIKLTIHTQELKPEQAQELFKLKGSLGYLLFKESPMKEEDLNIPDVVPEFKGDKSPSQRLRAVMYVIWTQGGKKTPFEQWYRVNMEKIIEGLKEKLS